MPGLILILTLTITPVPGRAGGIGIGDASGIGIGLIIDDGEGPSRRNRSCRGVGDLPPPRRRKSSIIESRLTKGSVRSDVNPSSGRVGIADIGLARVEDSGVALVLEYHSLPAGLGELPTKVLSVRGNQLEALCGGNLVRVIDAQQRRIQALVLLLLLRDHGGTTAWSKCAREGECGLLRGVEAPKVHGLLRLPISTRSRARLLEDPQVADLKPRNKPLGARRTLQVLANPLEPSVAGEVVGWLANQRQSLRCGRLVHLRCRHRHHIICHLGSSAVGAGKIASDGESCLLCCVKDPDRFELAAADADRSPEFVLHLVLHRLQLVVGVPGVHRLEARISRRRLEREPFGRGGGERCLPLLLERRELLRRGPLHLHLPVAFDASDLFWSQQSRESERCFLRCGEARHPAAASLVGHLYEEPARHLAAAAILSHTAIARARSVRLEQFEALSGCLLESTLTTRRECRRVKLDLLLLLLGHVLRLEHRRALGAQRSRHLECGARDAAVLAQVNLLRDSMLRAAVAQLHALLRTETLVHPLARHCRRVRV